jgi:hypothetical protein
MREITISKEASTHTRERERDARCGESIGPRSERKLAMPCYLIRRKGWKHLFPIPLHLTEDHPDLVKPVVTPHNSARHQQVISRGSLSLSFSFARSLVFFGRLKIECMWFIYQREEAGERARRNERMDAWRARARERFEERSIIITTEGELLILCLFFNFENFFNLCQLTRRMCVMAQRDENKIRQMQRNFNRWLIKETPLNTPLILQLHSLSLSLPRND